MRRQRAEQRLFLGIDRGVVLFSEYLKDRAALVVHDQGKGHVAWQRAGPGPGILVEPFVFFPVGDDDRFDNFGVKKRVERFFAVEPSLVAVKFAGRVGAQERIALEAADTSLGLREPRQKDIEYGGEQFFNMDNGGELIKGSIEKVEL